MLLCDGCLPFSVWPDRAFLVSAVLQLASRDVIFASQLPHEGMLACCCCCHRSHSPHYSELVSAALNARFAAIKYGSPEHNSRWHGQVLQVGGGHLHNVDLSGNCRQLACTRRTCMSMSNARALLTPTIWTA